MESLNVYFGQILTGILSLNTDRSFSYQYDQHWMASQDGFQLSVSLPMQEAPITGSHVRAFFANLLPESAVRNRVARSLGLSEKNDFMLRQLPLLNQRFRRGLQKPKLTSLSLN